MERAPWIATMAVVLALSAGSAVRAEDAPATDTPPLVEYAGGSRSSSTWVEMPGGTRVGVDRGAAWKGVKVYLSLTWQLVGVDVETGKTLFGTSVGAYWNAFTFKAVTPADGVKRWAIELRPGARRRAAEDLRQYHDLRTGAKLDVPGLVEAPAGTRFDLRAAWKGDKSDIAEKFRLLVTTEKNWIALRERMFPAVDPARFGAIDFAQEVVFAIASGNSANSSGFVAREAYEDDDRILLRIVRSSFQSMNGYQKTRPWGFFVLPRRAKAYEVEIDGQGLIGGPPLWRPVCTLPRLPAPDAELVDLPAKSTKAHYGWSEDGMKSLRPAPPPPTRPK